MGRLKDFAKRFLHKGVRYWVTLGIMLLLGYFAGRSLESARFLSGARLKLYSLQMKTYIHPQSRPQHTMVLMIRDEDYWGPRYGGRTPVDRAQLAQLLDGLRQTGAARVVLDIDLRLPQYPKSPEDVTTVINKEKEDEKDTLGVQQCDALKRKATRDEDKDKILLCAVKNFCDRSQHSSAKGYPALVLGTSVKFLEDAPGSQEGYFSEVPSIFTDGANLPTTKNNGDFKFSDQLKTTDVSCPAKGYMQLPTDPRQIAEEVETRDGNSLDSLSLTTAKIIDRSLESRNTWHSEEYFHFAHFLDLRAFGYDLTSGPQAIGETYVSFTPRMLASALACEVTKEAIKSDAVLQKSPCTPEDINLLKDLMGKTVLIGGDWHTRAYGQGPSVDQYDSPSGVMPGVFLHANYVEAFLDDRALSTPVHDSVLIITESALVLFLLILGLYGIEGRWKWVWFASALLLTSLITYVLLANVSIFMDFFIPICILIAHALLDDLFFLMEELRKFGNYYRAHHGKHSQEDIDATL